MTDFLRSVLEHKDLFRWLLFFGGAWIIYRIVENDDDLEWVEFIAVKGADGKNHPSWDQVGKGTAVVIGSWAIVSISANVKADFGGFALVLGAYFTFTGAIAGYAAYLRSKVGREEKITITEPAPRGPVKVTVTESGPAASKDAPVPVEIVNGAGIQKPLSVKQTDDNPEKEKS